MSRPTKQRAVKPLTGKTEFDFVELTREGIFNDFLAQLTRHVKSVHTRKKVHADQRVWVQNNRWLNGQPWSYESSGPKIMWGEHDVRTDRIRRFYLPQYINDPAEIRTALKNRQAELTVNQVNENLYRCLTRPNTQIEHVFPTDALKDGVSVEKVRTAIIESPRIKRRLLRASNDHYVFDDHSAIHMTSALARSGGRAGSRDILIFDEYDGIPRGVIPIFVEMMSHSSLRLTRNISTPTTPGVGIDGLYGLGTGYEWHWKCPKCKRRQKWDWPENLIGFFEPSPGFDAGSPEYQKRLHQVYFGCRYCKAYIDRNSEYYGAHAQWDAARPGLAEEHASYSFVAGMIPWKTGKEILSLHHRYLSFPSSFYNEVWGTAHLKSMASLDIKDLYGIQRPWRMPMNRSASMHHVSMGIDHGENESWVIIIGDGFDPEHPELHCILYAEEISQATLSLRGFTEFKGPEHTMRMKQLIQLWRPEAVVSDMVGIGSDRTIALARAFPRITWGGMFDTAEMGRQLRNSKLLVPRWQSEERRTVTFSKINVIKDLMNEIRAKVWGMPAIAGEHAKVLDTFARHCTALGIRPQLDALTDREFEMAVRLKPDDHLFASLLYARVGWEGLTKMRSNLSPGIS